MADPIDEAKRKAEEDAVVSGDTFNRLVESLGGTASASAVFGDPIEKDGVTVIPVAMVVGGGGGGAGPMEGGGGAEGGGGGFGGMSRPAGVYVVRGDGVEWQPAIDVTILGLALIALVGVMARVLGHVLARRH
jgi:uncharacterized spore protein YtfJ